MAESGEPQGFWPEWMTPRRAWEFIKNVVALEQAVSELRVENKELREQVSRMQLQLTEQGAQIVMLTNFVRDSLTNRLDVKLEKLAAELLAKRV